MHKSTTGHLNQIHNANERQHPQSQMAPIEYIGAIFICIINKCNLDPYCFLGITPKQKRLLFLLFIAVQLLPKIGLFLIKWFVICKPEVRIKHNFIIKKCYNLLF